MMATYCKIKPIWLFPQKKVVLSMCEYFRDHKPDNFSL